MDILREKIPKSIHIPNLKHKKDDNFMDTIHMLDLYSKETENVK